MLEWLKEILGEGYSEDVDKRVSAEIGKGFVARKDFNDKNEALKNAEAEISKRDQQMEGLSKTSGDVESLKKQIADLQKQNALDKKKHDEEIARLKLDNAVDAALFLFSCEVPAFSA